MWVLQANNDFGCATLSLSCRSQASTPLMQFSLAALTQAAGRLNKTTWSGEILAGMLTSVGIPLWTQPFKWCQVPLHVCFSSSSHLSPWLFCPHYLWLSVLYCWHRLQNASLMTQFQDDFFNFLHIQGQSETSLEISIMFCSPTSNASWNWFIAVADFEKFMYFFSFLSASGFFPVRTGQMQLKFHFPNKFLITVFNPGQKQIK